MSDYYGIPVKILCNKSLANTVFTIGKTVCAIPPSTKSKFVAETYQVTKDLLAKDYDVILVGHSYGGSVVSRVAEILKSPESKLHMFTLGSIYVPEPSQTPYANITHIMFKGDVAMKCNKLKPEKHKFVKWIRRRGYTSPQKMKKSIFGSKEAWSIHNSYETVIEPIINSILKNTPVEDVY